ncbi:MAG: phosphoglycerate kinase [Brevundimonas subvibrioides]|uniref:Phosphoglycerate kinase n=1 Tax=Brevundimonas subvibrioides TaxID=74313 RepID=A0A258HKA4_9CAUL|nr:phosphoglycerate kinase [Brevundimonas subvibrioides]OYX57411.1 MAG: phosphoglycerate kinase [Brevundimonas subvibrioides]
MARITLRQLLDHAAKNDYGLPACNINNMEQGLAIMEAAETVAASKTLIWNGPLGVFEVPPFDAATVSVARHVAALARGGHIVAVGGGGDTVAALHHAGVADDMTFVSTAGGAFLEWMEGKPLPGVEALRA